jgi:hypothetical protein
MAEKLTLPDGSPVELDFATKLEREFHEAMAAPAQDEPAHAAPPRKDPEAPYGYNKRTGEPNKRAPGPGRPAHDKPRVAASSSATGKTETPDEIDARRASGVAGLFQIGSAGTLMMYQRTENIAWQADTIVLSTNAEQAGQVLADTAKQSPGIARLVDMVTAAGPYAALVTFGISITAQLTSNHGIGVGRMLGAQTPEDLVAEFEQAQDADSASRTE